MVQSHVSASAENYKKIDWVDDQTSEDLKDLRKSIEENGQTKEVFDVSVAKAYLETLKSKSWEELSAKNSASWIMAVQVALESL
jgi:protoheme ferro-lyase